MSSIDERQNIVVVGGGGAGAPAVSALSAKLDPSKYNLILITARPYFTHLTGCIRMLATSEGRLEDRILMPYDNNFVRGNGTLRVGKVVSIVDGGEKGGYVTLADGDRIDYSILVLAPGSIWEGPLAMPDTKSELMEWVTKWREDFEAATNVLIVGGGAVAVEYAGEIKDLWPSKKVTIVHGQSLLLNSAYPDKWRKDIERRVRRRGIDVVLNEHVPDDVVSDRVNTMTTRDGTVLRPDLVVPSRGIRPNTSFVASLGADTLNSSGHVKITPQFQLLSYPRIFAIGDIIDWVEQKQVGKYYTHTSIVADNVLAILDKRTTFKMYKGSYEMIIITLGKYGGCGYFGLLWGIMLGDWLCSMLKSRRLMVGMTRKRMGLSD